MDMKKFLLKLSALALTSAISLLCIYFVMFSVSVNITGLASEVFYAIKKAGQNSGLPAVILGDSVCNQLWPQKMDTPGLSHLGCNQAITPAGTYLLLKKYLEHNPQTKEVYYLITPGSLGNDLGLRFTYQYFVIPFLDDENMKLIDEETRQKLYDKFGKFFVENGYVKNFLLNNNLFMEQYINYVRSKTEPSYHHRLSPTAIRYLPKIRQLCREHNAVLKVLPLPVPDVKGSHGWENFRADVRANGLDDILGDFTQQIIYYPEEWFRDGVHFTKEILSLHLEEIRRAILR